MIGTNLFANIQFALDLGSSPFKVKQHLRSLITTNGGIISYILTRKSKYLVVLKDSAKCSHDTYKYRKAKKMGIPIVTCDFVHECIRQKCIIDSDDFLVGAESVAQAFSKGKISSSGHGDLAKVKTIKKFNLNGASKYKIDSGDCPEFPSEFHVCKFAVLSKLITVNKVDMSQLACVEIHVALGHEHDNLVQIFRVMLSRTCGQKGDSVACYVYPVSNAIEALQCFDGLAKQEVDRGLHREHQIPAKFDIGSFQLKMLLSEMKSSSGDIDAEIVRLVETMWSDSLENLDDILNIGFNDITPDHLRNALIVLMKIENSIGRKDADELQKLSEEFYGIIPHNEKHRDNIDTVAGLAKKKELCQLLKDMLLVSETTLLDDQPNSSLSKYSSLNCSIVKLEENDNEMKQIKDMLFSESQLKSSGICIHNIFQVNRSVENVAFRSDLQPSKLLFHASAPHNFVGILSRGLLLPIAVTKELGVERTDEGNLGNGIYFTDSLMTASKYAMVSKSRGSRLLLVNDVVLGKIFETTEKMLGISSPPNGFQSVKGIPSSNGEAGIFASNEYAIYNSGQQRMKYVVEFTLKGDERKENLFTQQAIPTKRFFSQDPEISDTVDFTQKQRKQQQAGLLLESHDQATAKLEEVHVRAKIIDLAAEVIVFQTYTNKSRRPVEAKYVFPLSENAAVCGFEAFINDKHVVGVVKEKEKAHKEYKQAISEGHGAYLMDEEKANVFTVSVGNIPPSARVVIKIVYVSELTTSGTPDSKVKFLLPGSIAPWDDRSVKLLNAVTQSSTRSKLVSLKGKSSLIISIDMPFNIISVESPSHKIDVKRTATKACAKLDASSFITDKEFLLEIGMAEIHVPRIWIEKEHEESGEQVAMVTFYPEFDFEQVTDFECLILLDMSNSMNGRTASHARAVATMLIQSLPGSSKFNIVAFGSRFAELFFTYEKATDDYKTKAKTWVASCTANFGGSDALNVFNSAIKLYDGRMGLFNVFLISDGHLSESDNLMRLAHVVNKSSRSAMRIFSFGVGSSPNSHLLQSLSVTTGGWFEHLNPDQTSTWKQQVLTQMEKASQPVLTDIHIDWCNYSEESDHTLKSEKPVQVPEHVRCLFSGSQLVAYSYLPRCTKATLNASVNGKDFSTVVTATDLCITQGKTLHRLAAKAIFKEYETGILESDPLLHFMKKDERKPSIVSLSVQYSVVTKYTSFVAIEKREKDGDAINCSPSVSDLIEKSFEDVLPEIEWTNNEVSTDNRLENLLQRAKQIESTSIVEARQMISDARELFLSLPDPNQEKDLLISAAECRLDMDSGTEVKSKLARIFLGDDDKINYEFLKEFSKKEKTELHWAMKDLLHKAWPRSSIIKLMNFNEQIQPFIVGAFSQVQRDPLFTGSQETQDVFWKEVETLKYGTGETSLKDNAVKLTTIIKDTLAMMRVIKSSNARSIQSDYFRPMCKRAIVGGGFSFGSVCASSSSLFGSVPDGSSSLFGSVPNGSCSPFGSVPARSSSLFGSVPARSSSIFGIVLPERVSIPDEEYSLIPFASATCQPATQRGHIVERLSAPSRFAYLPLPPLPIPRKSPVVLKPAESAAPPIPPRSPVVPKPARSAAVLSSEKTIPVPYPSSSEMEFSRQDLDSALPSFRGPMEKEQDSDSGSLSSTSDSDSSMYSELDECLQFDGWHKSTVYGKEFLQQESLSLVSETDPTYTLPFMQLKRESVSQISSEILDKANQKGVWCLNDIESDNCTRIVSSLYQYCSDVIVNSGGPSLGSLVFANAVRMLFTSVCIEIMKANCSLCVGDLAKYEKTLKAAAEWLTTQDKIDPFLYSRLELGRCWSHAARCILAKFTSAGNI